MNSALIRLPAEDSRQEPRTSLFVMAALYSSLAAGPVKVRDLSSTGALIEGGVIPPAGTKVRLSRGSLEVAGEVVWCREGKAGLHFHSNVAVREWLPGQRVAAPQRRVDEAFQHFRSVPSAPLATRQGESIIEPAKVTARELAELTSAIEALAEELASDPEVVSRHAERLQSLDLATQVLTRLAAEWCPDRLSGASNEPPAGAADLELKAGEITE